MDESIYNILDRVLPCGLVHPNVVTIIAFLVIFPIIYMLKRRMYALAVVLIVFRSILDMMDGALARKCNQTSKFGHTLDAIADNLFHIILSIFVLSKLKVKMHVKVIAFIVLFLIGQYCSKNKFLSANTLPLYVVEALGIVYVLRKWA